jgi:ABC-type phosphate/phosphonate transport system substrate-binding protein
MYSVESTTATLWRALFDWAGTDAGIALEVIDHRPPATLRDLWRRADLACALICGYPWATWNDPSTARPYPLAVPLIATLRQKPVPSYCTDIVVRAESHLKTVDDLRGCRFAYTAIDSQSGYQAPRRFFAERAQRAGGRWFASTVGPLITPRRVVEALLNNEADAGPLDSYWHALLCVHEPGTAAQLRVITSTPMTAMPLLVCSAGISVEVRQSLAQSLAAFAHAAEMYSVRKGLLLAGFTTPDPVAYAELVKSAAESDALGYPVLQ